MGGGKSFLNLKKPGGSAAKLVEEMAAVEVTASDFSKEENVKVNEKVNVKVKQKEDQENSSISAIFKNKHEKEKKTRQVNLRVKETVWADFDYVSKKLGMSQSDYFEVIVQLGKIELEKAEKEKG